MFASHTVWRFHAAGFEGQAFSTGGVRPRGEDLGAFVTGVFDGKVDIRARRVAGIAVWVLLLFGSGDIVRSSSRHRGREMAYGSRGQSAQRTWWHEAQSFEVPLYRVLH